MTRRTSHVAQKFPRQWPSCNRIGRFASAPAVSVRQVIIFVEKTDYNRIVTVNAGWIGGLGSHHVTGVVDDVLSLCVAWSFAAIGSGRILPCERRRPHFPKRRRAIPGAWRLFLPHWRRPAGQR